MSESNDTPLPKEAKPSSIQSGPSENRFLTSSKEKINKSPSKFLNLFA